MKVGEVYISQAFTFFFFYLIALIYVNKCTHHSKWDCSLTSSSRWISHVTQKVGVWFFLPFACLILTWFLQSCGIMLFLFVILWLLALKKLESITKCSLITPVTPGNKIGTCHCSVVASQYSDCITQVIDSKKHLSCCLITKLVLFFPPFFRVWSCLLTAQAIS